MKRRKRKAEENPVARAVAVVGGPTKAARLCGVSNAAVHRWIRSGSVILLRHALCLSQASRGSDRAVRWQGGRSRLSEGNLQTGQKLGRQKCALDCEVLRVEPPARPYNGVSSCDSDSCSAFLRVLRRFAIIVDRQARLGIALNRLIARDGCTAPDWQAAVLRGQRSAGLPAQGSRMPAQCSARDSRWRESWTLAASRRSSQPVTGPITSHRLRASRAGYHARLPGRAAKPLRGRGSFPAAPAPSLRA